MAKTLKLDAVRRACSVGNKLACQLSLRFAPGIFGAAHLSFSSIELEDENPNKMPFNGVLLLVDVPSTKPPHGSRGHRILVPKSVAKKRLSGLVGMGLNYEPSLQSHAPRRKVGVITEAWLDGDKVRVKGIVYKKDFPEVESDFKRGRLGMSMELANVYVRDEKADVWYLEDFHFTGATVLMKDAAAYYQTALAAKAAKARVLRGAEGETIMLKKKKEQRTVSAGFDADVLTKSFSSALKPVINALQAQGEAITGLRAETADMKELFSISAAARDEEDVEENDEIEASGDESEDDIEASEDIEAHHGDDEDPSDEDDPSADEDASDMDAMEDLEEESVEEEPGSVNKKRGDKNKGNKTSVTEPPSQGAKVPGNIAKKRLSSAAMGGKMKGSKPFPGLKSSAANIQAAAFIGDLKAQVRQLKAEMTKRDVYAAKLEKKYNKLHTRYESMEAQVARYAETEGRRSQLPMDIVNVAAKSNLDLHEMQAAGQKLSTDQIDQVLDNSGLGLDPTQRMTLKNKFLENGLMEQGEIRRVQ